MKVLRKSLSF